MSGSRITAEKIDQWVGSRIRVKRQRMRLGVSELAEAVGVAPQMIKDYEDGALRVSAAHLVAIAKVLQAPLGDFFAFPLDSRCSRRPQASLN
ncbi:transcriptional regulator with XRE-family HTH domain [Rhodoblastus acidophilus]|uniref:helix-turn-helix domain-containing protein n=1 Tax=Rhodoblastus acidophilus TaxID=1074 RepID=UPI002224A802|nr:helix-turn-helix transcriptional regulator [Rhodoblastus acidophilus]MCW2283496.1 transcriptional regulator with XRE-family HTH domain [Rhodoblastus acidophilus]MCW2332356.1 transcriptional regulator with XRE-family HTH domain [Rhodoblastus acidophilus]